MDPAAQIQTQLHGPRADGLEPGRGGLGHIQGNKKVFPQRLLNNGPRLQLVFGAVYPNQSRALIQVNTLHRNASVREGFHRPLHRLLAYLGTATGTGDLDGIVVRKYVW